MLTFLAFLLCGAGFAALSLSMTKYARDVFGRATTQRERMAFRVAGWTLLALSLWPCIANWGVSIGLVAWFGLATVAVLLVAMALTYGAPSSGPRSARKGGAR